MNFKLFGSLVILSMILMPIVSAYSWAQFDTDLAGGITRVEPVLKYIIGFSLANSDNATTAVLMLILVFLVIYGILSPMEIFGDKEWVNVGIAALVAIIGVRFLPENLISIIVTPTTALFAAIVIGAPMLILLGITMKARVITYAKPIWWTYAGLCIFLGIYNLGKDTPRGIAYVFLVAAIIAVIIGIFIRKIKGMKQAVDENDAIANTVDDEILYAENDLNAQVIALKAATPGSRQAMDLEKKIADSKKKMKSLRALR